MILSIAPQQQQQKLMMNNFIYRELVITKKHIIIEILYRFVVQILFIFFPFCFLLAEKFTENKKKEEQIRNFIRQFFYLQINLFSV